MSTLHRFDTVQRVAYSGACYDDLNAYLSQGLQCVEHTVHHVETMSSNSSRVFQFSYHLCWVF